MATKNHVSYLPWKPLPVDSVLGPAREVVESEVERHLVDGVVVGDGAAADVDHLVQGVVQGEDHAVAGVGEAPRYLEKLGSHIRFCSMHRFSHIEGLMLDS